MSETYYHQLKLLTTMEDKNIRKEYSNGEITVVWEASKCTHSAHCVKNLPQVFNPREKPWIKMNQATSDAIVETVKKCPSGALSLLDSTK